MVYKGKSEIYKWMITGGTPIYGNLHATPRSATSLWLARTEDATEDPRLGNVIVYVIKI